MVINSAGIMSVLAIFCLYIVEAVVGLEAVFFQFSSKNSASLPQKSGLTFLSKLNVDTNWTKGSVTDARSCSVGGYPTDFIC